MKSTFNLFDSQLGFKKAEIYLFIILILFLFLFLCFKHSDIEQTIGSSFALIHGHFRDFYEYNSVPGLGDSNYLPFFAFAPMILFKEKGLLKLALHGLIVAAPVGFDVALYALGHKLSKKTFWGSRLQNGLREDQRNSGQRSSTLFSSYSFLSA